MLKADDVKVSYNGIHAVHGVSLHVDEVNAVLHTLGNLPTSSGAWPLVVKIKEQAEGQLPQQPATPAPGEFVEAE